MTSWVFFSDGLPGMWTIDAAGCVVEIASKSVGTNGSTEIGDTLLGALIMVEISPLLLDVTLCCEDTFGSAVREYPGVDSAGVTFD